MVDVALLTDKGIIFCEVERQMIDELVVELRRSPNITRLAIVITKDGRDFQYSVEPTNILLRLGSSRR